MSEPKHIKWLYQELPNLVSEGILPEDSAARLKDHYGQIDEKPAYNIALVLAAILGSVLIGGGIILLFAHNWDQFSRPVRALLSFAPLVIAQLIYGYTFFKKNKETAWVEASSAFLMLMLAASIALISQTYHIQGKFEDFLLVWMLLSIPLLYLMNATLPALFYLFGICSWVMGTSFGHRYWYWFLLLAAVPHLVLNMHLKKDVVRSRLLGWMLVLTFSTAFFQLFGERFGAVNLVAGGAFLAMFYLLGERIYGKTESLRNKPFQLVSACIAFGILMLLGYEWPRFKDAVLPDVDNKYDVISFYITFGVAILSYIYLVYQGWKAEHRLNYFMILLPPFLFVGQLLSYAKMSTVAIVLANVYLFGFGVYYMKDGIEKRNLTLVNLGMFFISALIVARFFDADWGFVVKGLVFILLGIGFLYVNVFLSQKLKSDNELPKI